MNSLTTIYLGLLTTGACLLGIPNHAFGGPILVLSHSESYRTEGRYQGYYSPAGEPPFVAEEVTWNESGADPWADHFSLNLTTSGNHGAGQVDLSYDASANLDEVQRTFQYRVTAINGLFFPGSLPYPGPLSTLDIVQEIETTIRFRVMTDVILYTQFPDVSGGGMDADAVQHLYQASLVQISGVPGASGTPSAPVDFEFSLRLRQEYHGGVEDWISSRDFVDPQFTLEWQTTPGVPDPGTGLFSLAFGVALVSMLQRHLPRP